MPTDQNPHTLIIEVEHAVAADEWTRALDKIDTLTREVQSRASGEFAGSDTDPEAELTWRKLRDEDLGLSVGDVVLAAESVAEGARQHPSEQFEAGKVSGALAVAELLTSQGPATATAEQSEK
jgi:hypothetical protein